MRKITNLVSRFGVSVLSLALPVLALAAPATPGPASGVENVPYAHITTVQGVLDYVCIIYGWLFYFLIGLVIIFIVLAAYRYLTSAGDPEKVKSATNTLLYAAIAVAVALLAWGIPRIVGDFLGVSEIASC